MSASILWPEVCFTPSGLLLRNCLNGRRSEAGMEEADASGEAWSDLLSQVASDCEADGGPSFEPLVRCGLASVNPAGPLAGIHADFMALRRSARFWDYSQPGAIARDARDMQAYERLDPAPVLDLGPSPESSIPDGWVDSHVLHIVRTVFGRREIAAFHHQRVERKVVPSIGARHGLTCHVVVPPSGDQPARCVRVPSHGQLAECALAAPAPGAPFPSLLAGVHFELYQWRYRTGWIYPCIYLDLGHAVAAIRCLAAQAGIRCRLRRPRSPASCAFPELVAEPLLEIRLYPSKEAPRA